MIVLFRSGTYVSESALRPSAEYQANRVCHMQRPRKSMAHLPRDAHARPQPGQVCHHLQGDLPAAQALRRDARQGRQDISSPAPPPPFPIPNPKKKKTNNHPGPYDSFLAGLLGGYIVFGQRSRRSGKISSVNQQIVIYVFARVALALARLAVKPGYGLPGVSDPKTSAAVSYYAWPVFASVSWAAVMHLFKWHAAELQPSLRSSMTYIYKNSDEWDGARNFLWHNK